MKKLAANLFIVCHYESTKTRPEQFMSASYDNVWKESQDLEKLSLSLSLFSLSDLLSLSLSSFWDQLLATGVTWKIGHQNSRSKREIDELFSH